MQTSEKEWTGNGAALTMNSAAHSNASPHLLVAKNRSGPGLAICSSKGRIKWAEWKQPLSAGGGEVHGEKGRRRSPAPATQVLPSAFIGSGAIDQRGQHFPPALHLPTV